MKRHKALGSIEDALVQSVTADRLVDADHCMEGFRELVRGYKDLANHYSEALVRPIGQSKADVHAQNLQAKRAFMKLDDIGRKFAKKCIRPGTRDHESLLAGLRRRR